MPRGGRRTGAGRPKKPTHLRAIDGGAGRRPPAALDPSTDPSTDLPAAPACLEAPASLTPEERIVWDEWAALAHAAQTLVPSTLGTFVRLCQAEADRRWLRARYLPVRVGATGEFLPLLVTEEKTELQVRRLVVLMDQRITALAKDFKLAPFGKEIPPPGARAIPFDPLDVFTQRRG